MENMKQCLVSKVKSVISVIYGIVLWVTRLSSAMQTPNSLPSHPHLQLCIGSLICSTTETLNRHACNIHSYMVSSPSPSSSSSSSLSSPSSLSQASSSSSWSSTMGDLIGTESGVYVISNEETLSEKTEPYNYIRRKRNKQTETKREFPPPIPSLARTENLTGRMPWIFNRHYIDGRLVLRERRAKHYEYFETHRENGRLTLNLVLLDDTFRCCHSVYAEDEDEDEDVEAIDEHVEAENDDEDEGK